jgi:hypothetical protein
VKKPVGFGFVIRAFRRPYSILVQYSAPGDILDKKLQPGNITA